MIGFQILSESNQEAVLTADGIRPLLRLVQPEGVLPKEERKAGLYHVAILLPARTDLAAFLAYMLRKKYPLGAADHLVSEALYLNDPDGNGIEVYHDRPSTNWHWNKQQVAMTTDPLDGDDLLAEDYPEWHTLPSETIIGHIHLHVADVEAAKVFYVQGLGFSVTTTYPGALFLSTKHYHHHIAVNVWNGAGAEQPTKNSVGLQWFSLAIPDVSLREQMVECLAKLGFQVRKEADQVWTADPSGNRIKLVIAPHDK